MLGVVGDRLPNRALALYVPRGDALRPVASSTELDAGRRRACEKLATDPGPVATGDRGSAASRSRPATGDRRRARVPSAAQHGSQSGELPFDELTAALAPSAVKLDTALLFAHFRDDATADERQRLAREMHDGVAQDIASLGYLVDALAARPADEQQAKQFAMLRERVTKVVAEVRRSVMNLRTSIGENESLGAAISAVARHLSEASGIPIRVRLDEQPARLRPEVEAELFRIAQEAMNNAVKHARRHRDRRALPGLRARGADHGRRRRRRPAERPRRLPRPEDHARTREADRRAAEGARQRQPRTHRLGRAACSGWSTSSRPGRTEQGESTMTTTTSPILLVDDHELIRSGLGAVLDLEPDMQVVGTAGTVARRSRRTTACADVVVTDLQLQDGTGLDIVRTIRKESDKVGLVVLTMHSGDDQIFAAMQAGASGFVGKDAPSTEVIEAARHAAVSPRAFVCAGLVGAMMRRRSGEVTALSEREHDVLMLLAEGLDAAAIGGEALPVGVDDQVPHRADLPEAGRRQPRPGAGHGDADRAALDRAAGRAVIAVTAAARSACVGSQQRTTGSETNSRSAHDGPPPAEFSSSGTHTPGTRTFNHEGDTPMTQYLRFCSTPARDEERGATAVEYGLLVALIAAVIIAVVGLLGRRGQRRFTESDARSTTTAAGDQGG